MRDNYRVIDQGLKLRGAGATALRQRLEQVLSAKRWTARYWSIGAGLSPDAIRNIFRDKSGAPRIDTLEKLAAYAGCSVEWLRGRDDGQFPGRDDAAQLESPARAVSLPLIGYIGAGDTVYHFGLSEARELVPAPPDVARGIAAAVRGVSMLPVYRDGDLVIGAEHLGSLQELVGQDCFVQVQDGPLYLKTLQKGAKGRFHLDSYNSEVPRIENQQIEWAAPVRWIKRKS